jgi:cytoskeletal protein CcmA (bactofilin family)
VSNFYNNSHYSSDITTQGELVFNNGVDFNGQIIAEKSVTLENTVKATSILSGGDVTILNNVEVADYVAGNNIEIKNNGKITGAAIAYGSITMGSPSEITGNVYYNLDLIRGGDNAKIGGTITQGGVPQPNVNIEKFPVLVESLYSQCPPPPAMVTESGSYKISGSFNVDGIYYVPGNLDIQGDYTGNGMIVTKGKVNITGDLKRYDENTFDGATPTHSLAIAAFGQDTNGISINSLINCSIEALLYTPNKIYLQNSAGFFGSMVCGQVDVKQNGKVFYDESLYTNHPKWLTTVVKIKSWKEANSVF